ncbi:hypothetical protein [Haloferula helveola]
MAFLLSVTVGAAAGFVLGLVGEPALDASDIFGGHVDALGLIYLLFCIPALMLLPWQIHDIPVLRGVLAGMFWALLGFGVWWLFQLWKARKRRMRASHDSGAGKG